METSRPQVLQKRQLFQLTSYSPVRLPSSGNDPDKFDYMLKFGGNVQNNVLTDPHKVPIKRIWGTSWKFETFAITSEATVQKASFIYQIKCFGLMYKGNILVY